jgi:hypothetical protein
MKNHLQQFSIPLENQPGTLHRVLKTLSAAGINILGVSSEGVGGLGFVHLVSDTGVKALKVLEKAGFHVFHAPVFNVDLANRPGELARLTKALAEKGVNVVQIYGTTSGHVGRLLFTVDAPEKAQPLLAKFAKLGPMSLAAD